MMHNDGMSQLDLLVKRFSPPLLEVSRDSPEEPTLAPGDRVQAHVLANLPNGRFHVLIKDQVLDMNLPPNTQAGEKLDLSVVKTQPRLTFAVTEDLQRALPQAAPNVKLSDAVKYLGALLSRAAPEGSKAAQSAAQASPLLAAGLADIDTGKLAESMQQQLSDSGVFLNRIRQSGLPASVPCRIYCVNPRLASVMAVASLLTTPLRNRATRWTTRLPIRMPKFVRIPMRISRRKSS